MDEQGVWHVRGYHAARAILRAEQTTQAGFKAEDIYATPLVNQPILYMEGKAHHEQRRATARFFTPHATRTYAALTHSQAEAVLAPLRAGGEADLSRLAMALATRVTAQIVGLTDSWLPGMAGRLAGFLEQEPTEARWRQQCRRGPTACSLASFFCWTCSPRFGNGGRGRARM